MQKKKGKINSDSENESFHCRDEKVFAVFLSLNRWAVFLAITGIGGREEEKFARS